MKLKIVTPERVVFDDEVEAVYAQAVDGQVGILPKHVPMVTPLDIAVLRFAKNGDKQPVAVMGGVLKTDGQSVTILSDSAELGSEIDAVRAEQALKRAEAVLSQKTAELDQARAERALARARVRLSLAHSR